jgi:hypothetical protein
MMLDALRELLQGLFGSVFPLVWTLLKIVLIIAPLLLCVAYLTFWERKVIGWMQVRIGPEPGRPLGADPADRRWLKLFLKEVVIPTGADKSVFLIAPMFAFAPALAAWAVVPFNDTWCWPTSMPACSTSWPSLDRRLRDHPRRLGLQFEVRLPWRHALGSADDFLRMAMGWRWSSC